MSAIKNFRIKSYKKRVNPILKLNNVSLSYGKNLIFNDFNLDLMSNQILGLLGPNGVGKSSIFNIIMGIIMPNGGDIIINDKRVNNYPIYERAIKFKIGYVPQYGGFFHDLTVKENLKAISEITIRDSNIRKIKVENSLSKFQLNSISNTKADFLSGGQKKKLVIALSLMSNPKILLLDEPFAALDILTIKTLQQIIVNLQKEEDISIILCDHQARDLLACVDIAAIIYDGKVIAKDTPNNLIVNTDAQNVYFGEKFKIN